jgi:AcrR family transcriptional regulator
MMSASFENANKRYAVLCTYERLAEDKPLPEITVLDICNAHGISRSTFYRLFGGVDDILMWYQNFASDIGMHRAGIMYTFKEGQYTTLALLDRFRHLFNQRYIKSTAYWNPDFSFQCINNHVDAMRRMLESRNVEMTTELLFKLRGVAVVVHEMGRYYARDDIWSGKTTSLPVTSYANGSSKVQSTNTSPGSSRRISSNMREASIPECAVIAQCVDAPPTGKLV